MSAGEFLAAYAALALVPVVVQLASPRVLRRRSATPGYRTTLLFAVAVVTFLAFPSGSSGR